MFDIVVAADFNWGIGKTNGLPWPRLKGDFAHFKRLTTQAPDGYMNAIIMGRKTWQSKEINGKPLPKRLNVVMSSSSLEVPDGVLVVHSMDDALRIRESPSLPIHDIFVIGGAAVYNAVIDHPGLRSVYLTRVHGDFGCDVKIPNLDDLGFCRCPWTGETEAEEAGVKYTIECLSKIAA